jgi:HSP20 family protein
MSGAYNVKVEENNMSIIRYNPFSEMISLRQVMDRLFEDSVINTAGYPSDFTEKLAPKVDIYQTQDAVKVKAVLPGLNSDDINVDISENTLTIKGEFKNEEEAKEDDYLYQERRYGSFCRSFTLPNGIQIDKADAIMEDGILTINIPKAEEAKPRTIKIKAKDNK